MLLKLAWKNIWRNKVRSTVLLFAIAIGIWAGVFLWAIYAGLVKQRVSLAIDTETSHIQIHKKGYIEDPDLKNYIHDSTIRNFLLNLPEISAVSERIIANGMIMSAETGSGVRIVGIDPGNEKKVTNIYNKIIEGSYLDINSVRNPIIIGKKLADKLNVKIKSKVVIVTQQIDGSIVKDQYRVVGIYRTSNSMFDEMNVFVLKNNLSTLLNIDNNCTHEIAIRLNSNELLENAKLKLNLTYSEYDIKTWLEVMPEVKIVVETMDLTMIIFLGIMLFALIFVIINTMLMAILERVKELGMLMAIGMNKTKIFMMIMYETVLLTFTGAIIGIFIAVVNAIVFSKTGINLSVWSDAFASIGYDAIIYPVLETKMVIITTIMVISTGILASIYPAIKALSLKPVEALHTDV